MPAGVRPPADGVRTSPLFGLTQLIDAPGAVIALTLKQHEVVRATYDPEAPKGVRAEEA